MTMHAGIGDIATDVAHLLLVSGLGCAVRGSSHFRHFFGETNPIGIAYWNRLAVFTTTPWSKHQGRRFGQGDSGIIDDLPSGIEIVAPSGPIESAIAICGKSGLGSRLRGGRGLSARAARLLNVCGEIRCLLCRELAGAIEGHGV